MTAEKPGMEHVARPNLPWRDERRTECGLPDVPTRVIITTDELQAKVKAQGQQRAAMSTCMTCWHSCDRNQDTWATSPASVMLRHVKKAWWGDGSEEELRRLNLEFRAIAALVEAHRDQFDGFLADAGSASDLAKRRHDRALRAARQPRLGML